MSKRAGQNRKQTGAEHFTKMLRKTMEEPAWRALSPKAQALFPWIKLEWKGPQANNNGQLRFSYRQAAAATGIKSLDTVARAFKELEAKGFIVVHEIAVLGTDGKGKCFEYEITDIAMPGRDSDNRPNEARRLYKKWKFGADFQTTKANANNEFGKNGNKKSHHKKQDGGHIENGMEKQSLTSELGHPPIKTTTNGRQLA